MRHKSLKIFYVLSIKGPHSFFHFELDETSFKISHTAVGTVSCIFNTKFDNVRLFVLCYCDWEYCNLTTTNVKFRRLSQIFQKPDVVRLHERVFICWFVFSIFDYFDSFQLFCYFVRKSFHTLILLLY